LLCEEKEKSFHIKLKSTKNNLYKKENAPETEKKNNIKPTTV
jgi:hypothetical protein